MWPSVCALQTQKLSKTNPSDSGFMGELVNLALQTQEPNSWPLKTGPQSWSPKTPAPSDPELFELGTLKIGYWSTNSQPLPFAPALSSAHKAFKLENSQPQACGGQSHCTASKNLKPEPENSATNFSAPNWPHLPEPKAIILAHPQCCLPGQCPRTVERVRLGIRWPGSSGLQELPAVWPWIRYPTSLSPSPHLQNGDNTFWKGWYEECSRMGRGSAHNKTSDNISFFLPLQFRMEVSNS